MNLPVSRIGGVYGCATKPNEIGSPTSKAMLHPPHDATPPMNECLDPLGDPNHPGPQGSAAGAKLQHFLKPVPQSSQSRIVDSV